LAVAAVAVIDMVAGKDEAEVEVYSRCHRRLF
jgi:hypothetical protein